MDKKKTIFDIELGENEEVCAETLEELSNGKGGNEDE